MTSAVPGIRLNNRVDIPQVGFGVFRMPDDATPNGRYSRQLSAATAASTRPPLYGNEAGVGRAVAAAGSPATSCSSPPSSGTTTRATTARSARSTRACGGSAWTTSTCT